MFPPCQVVLGFFVFVLPIVVLFITGGLPTASILKFSTSNTFVDCLTAHFCLAWDYFASTPFCFIWKYTHQILGTFLVILGQTRTRSGEHFFRVMDGWIPEIELGLTIVERLSYPDRMRSSPPYYTQHPSLSPCLPVRCGETINFTPFLNCVNLFCRHAYGY